MFDSILQILNEEFVKNPNLTQELSLAIHSKIIPNAINDFLINHSIIELSHLMQRLLNWQNISFDVRFLISRFIFYVKQAEIQEKKLILDSHPQVILIVKETKSIHHKFYNIARSNNNFIVLQNDSNAYRQFLNFINLFSNEAKLTALRSILNSRSHLFYFKYFKNINSTDLNSIFTFHYCHFSNTEKINFCFAYHDFMVILERFELSRKLMSFLLDNTKDRYDNRTKLLVTYRTVIRLARMESSLSLDSIISFLNVDTNEFTMSKLKSMNINGFELEFKQAFYSSMINNDVIKDIPHFLKELQFQLNPFCVYEVLKKLTTFSQLATFNDKNLCWMLPLFLAQYSCKNFKQYSSYFVGALKCVIKMLMGLNVSTKKLAEQALGLSEMIYFAPSRSLSSIQLLLSKSIQHHFIISKSIAMPLEDYNLTIDYGLKCYEMTKHIEKPEKTKLKSLMWLLQLTQKYTPEEKLTSEFRDYFNELCLLISNFEKVNAHLYELYRCQLEFIDTMTTAIYKNNYEALSEFQLMILNSFHMIEEKDSLIIRKMKMFCKYSPMVAKYVDYFGLHNMTTNCNTLSDIVYENLLEKPKQEFLYDMKLWTAPGARMRDDLSDSGTEDSESDSLSESSTNTYSPIIEL